MTPGWRSLLNGELGVIRRVVEVFVLVTCRGPSTGPEEHQKLPGPSLTG